MATFSSAGLTIQFSFESRPRRGQQQSQHNSYAWELWKLGYGISVGCVDSQRKEHPLGLKRARYNNKRDGKGVFPVPHRRMPLYRPFLIYLSITQAGIASTTPTRPGQCCAVRSSTNPRTAHLCSRRMVAVLTFSLNDWSSR